MGFSGTANVRFLIYGDCCYGVLDSMCVDPLSIQCETVTINWDSQGLPSQDGAPRGAEGGAGGAPREWQVQHDPRPHLKLLQDRPQSNHL